METKKISLLTKFFIILNVILAIITLLTYVLPFLAPKWFPFLSVLTLFLPFILIINICFFLFWAIQLKKYIFISGILLLLGITLINKFFNLESIVLPKEPNDFTLMSYNVRLFNKFNWNQKANIPEKINAFITEQNPDILCIQEYTKLPKTEFTEYPFRHINIEGENILVGNAIFSKFKIINSGKIDFKDSDNGVVFVDILKGIDTLRVYSMHLQSIKISTEIEDEDLKNMNESKTKRLFTKISDGFKKQQDQAQMLKENLKKCKFKKILCGDMNNSAFSYVYKTIKGSMQDAFETNGEGFGKTYNFKYYPARIDYIFTDKIIKIKRFDTFNDFYNSDHFPLMCHMKIN